MSRKYHYICFYTFTNGHQEHPPRGQDTGSSARAPPVQTCKRCLTMLMNNTWRRCGKATYLSIVHCTTLTSIIACTSLLELDPRWRPPGLHCSGTRVLNLGSVPHIRHLCTLAVFAENIFECQEIFLILSWIIALCLVESNWIIHVSNVWHVGKESAILRKFRNKGLLFLV